MNNQKCDMAIVVRKHMSKHKRNDLLFYIIMIALPVAQFCIFYIAVNINSIFLAFKSYNRDANGYVWVGVKNITAVLQEFMSSFTLQKAFMNSFLVWALCTFITLPLALIFSFFIYKKFPLKNLFKLSLFLPSIISGIVTVVIYTYFVERAIPAIFKVFTNTSVSGMLSNPKTQFFAVLFYNIFYAFGSYMLLFTGGMNSVDPSVSEAAALDGAAGFKEFWHIVMPKVYPTLTTFLVLSVAGIFSNQFALYSFYGTAASSSIITFGYYLYAVTSVATIAEYPHISSIGLLMTCIIVPLTMLVKSILERVGPKEA